MPESEPVVTITREKEGKQSEPQLVMEAALKLYVALAPKYRLLEDNRNNLAIVKVVSPGVLRVVSQRDVVLDDMVRPLGNTFKPPQVNNDVFPRWLAEMRANPNSRLQYAEVKPFHFKSAELAAGYAWQRLSFDPLPDAPAPKLFASLMQRTSAEEALSIKLFIGSLFDYTSSRHQYLYLHGLGGDGKSTLIAAMFAMFADMNVMTMQGDSLDGTHSTAALEGVRLVAFPDCNRPSLPSTGVFKQVTGDDMVTINPKMKEMRNIRLHCKVVISSNDAPQLAGGNADWRRILPAFFDRKETTANTQWVADFIASAPQIAQHCIAIYNDWKVRNPGSEIPPATSALEMVQQDSTQALAEDLCDRLFEFGADKWIRASVLQSEIDSHTRGNDKLAKQILKVLRQRGGVSKTKRLEGLAARAWGGVGIRNTLLPMD